MFEAIYKQTSSPVLAVVGPSAWCGDLLRIHLKPGVSTRTLSPINNYVVAIQ